MILTYEEVLDLHQRILARTGGAQGLRDPGAMHSAVAQPLVSFDGERLYADLAAQAAALGFSLINNHPCVDGNKRIGHAAMNVLLVLNGYDIDADVDEQEEVVLNVASGTWDRDALTTWLRAHMVPYKLKL